MADVSPPPSAVEKQAAPPPRIRLDYLDGLRALCALFVVFGHSGDGGFFGSQTASRPAWLTAILPLAAYDRYAVAIFIVISGYCLMLPVARANGVLSGGAGAYFRRRARRMLPPYYAALGLSVLVIELARLLAVPMLGFTTGGLVSHLFLMHNLTTAWQFQINGPLWSVATEWDIYFFFPFLLLPLWRRFGILATMAVAFLIGLTPHFLLHKWLDPVAPWYLGLFAVGMAGALVNFSSEPPYRNLRERVSWGVLSAVIIGLLLIAFALKPARLPSYPLYITEPILGAGIVCLLIASTRALMDETAAKRPFVLRLLEQPVLVAIGLFSYSLYMVHGPLLTFLMVALRPAALPPMQKLGLLWLLGVPLAIGLSYGFHRLFERPFMPNYARKHTQ